MKQVNITAFIGKDYGIGEHTTGDIIETVNATMQRFGISGATFSEAVGIWNGEIEHSVRVEFLGVNERAAHMTLKAACRILKQWEIVYTINGAEMKSVKDNADKRRKAA